jgi:Tol biopolymer transport system component
VFEFTAAPSSWSVDGRHLVFVRDFDIWAVDLTGTPPVPVPVVQSPSRDSWPVLSPDGRWLAYGSDRSGRYGVYLEPFRRTGPVLQVSVDGGFSPAWNPNGRELFFSAPRPDVLERNAMMAVEVSLSGTAALGAPRTLFEFDGRELVSFRAGPASCYAISPDGERFYSIQHVKTDPPPPVTHINLVLNWRAELEAKVPSGL